MKCTGGYYYYIDKLEILKYPRKMGIYNLCGET